MPMKETRNSEEKGIYSVWSHREEKQIQRPGDIPTIPEPTLDTDMRFRFEMRS